MIDEKKYLTVTALNRYISYKIDTDIALKSIYIKGEISNARLSKGHLYFVLKDEESEVSAIIFYNVASKLTFIPKDGMKVYIHGTINTYSKKGTYNLIVNEIEEYGKGLIYQKFLELKQKLSDEGLFDPNRKKKIPLFPMHIGVVTSATADAFHDIVSTITKRFPLAKVRLYPSLVQGNDAPAALIKAIYKANEENICDVLLIARGGGSIEDLNCFNDEALARVIANSKIPTVSGVGHEQDYTICDFVSDLRAPTPTGAAVLVTNDKEILFKNLDSFKSSLQYNLLNQINHKEKAYFEIISRYGIRNFDSILLSYEKYIEQIVQKLNLLSPLQKLENTNKEINNLTERLHLINIPNKIDNFLVDINNIEKNLNTKMLSIVDNKDRDLDFSIEKMIIINPLNIMKKGYTLVYRDEKLTTSSNELIQDDIIDIRFHDGVKKAKVL